MVGERLQGRGLYRRGGFVDGWTCLYEMRYDLHVW
jgi:hypothetical protein